MIRIVKNLTLGLALASVFATAGHAAELTTIRLSRATDSIGALPIVVAEDHGLFTKNGLKVDIVDFKGGAPAVQAIISGDVEGCICAGDHVVNLTSRGFPAEIYIGLSDRHGYALMAGANSSTTDLKSLKGKRIGITSAGSQTDNTVRFDLREKGLNADTDVQIISVGTGGPMQAAIKSGAVEAGMFPSPFIEQNQRDGMKMIVDYRVLNYPSLTILGLVKWEKQNTAAAKKFVTAVKEAMALIKSNKQIAVAGAKKIAPNMNDELVNIIVDYFVANNLPANGIPDPKGFKLMNDMVNMADPSTRQVAYEKGVALDLLK